MKTLLLLLLSLGLVARATTVVFRYGINPDQPPNSLDLGWADSLDQNLTLNALYFLDDNGYALGVITNPPNGFEFVVPDGHLAYVSARMSDGTLYGGQEIPASGRWVFWSVPSDLTRDHLTAADRTDVAARAGLGFACIGLGALFFRCYKTGRSGT